MIMGIHYIRELLDFLLVVPPLTKLVHPVWDYVPYVARAEYYSPVLVWLYTYTYNPTTNRVHLVGKLNLAQVVWVARRLSGDGYMRHIELGFKVKYNY